MKKIILSISFICFSVIGVCSTEKVCNDASAAITSNPQLVYQCSDYASRNTAAIKASIDAVIEALENKYEECKINNGNCSNYKIKITKKDSSGGQTSTYESFDLTKIQEKKDSSYAELNKLAYDLSNKCINEVGLQGQTKCLAEFENSQKNLDMLVDIGTVMIAKLFPAQMSHVDVVDLLNGQPLGGDGAVLVSLRNSLLNVTGITGDLASIIKDPTSFTRNFTTHFESDAKRFLDNVCGSLCGNWKL